MTVEELETMDSSEIYAKRLNAKEEIFPKENGKFTFPLADGRIKFVGGDQELRTSILIRITQFEGKIKEVFQENQKGLHHHSQKTHFRMPVKDEMIFGPFQETS